MKKDDRARSSKASDSPFNSTRIAANIKGHMIKGAAASFGSQGARFFIQMATTAALGRLLTPQDFGLFAVALAFAGIATVFVDMGFTSATIQRETLDSDLASLLFFLSCGIGIVLFVLIAALAMPIAGLLNQPGLGPLVVALSLTLLVTALGLQHRALMIRSMRFPVLSLIDLCALILGSAVAIVLAVTTTLGVWCLVAMQITMPLVSTTGYWIMSGWRPSWVRDWSGSKSSIIFGLNITGYLMASYFGKQLDNILIGLRWGNLSVGFYSKAYGIMQIPMNAIATPLAGVISPALSRLQDNPERWKATFLLAVAGLTFVTAPLAVVMFVLSEDILRLLLGPQWIAAGPILRCLAIVAFIEPLAHTNTWALVSRGKGGQMLRSGLASTAVVIVGFIVGLPYGPTGVAIGYSVAMAVIALPLMIYAVRGSGLSIREYLMAALPQYLAAGVALAAAWLAPLEALSGQPILIRLLAGGSVIGLAYLSSFIVLVILLRGQLRPQRLVSLWKGGLL